MSSEMLYENCISLGDVSTMAESDKQHEWTKEYYSTVLSNSADLQTNACCTGSAPKGYIYEAIMKVHKAVRDKYYGCGLCMPDNLEGCSVLDLGCGSGRDVYIISQLVGKTGSVVGVDMTEEQLDVAREYVDWHTKAFGLPSPNMRFVEGMIENLEDLLPASSFDIIVSNCVINLVPNKRAVLQQAYKLLKPGGEMYFSDVYGDRRVPKELTRDAELWGECLSGALYWNDFHRLAKECGFLDPRLVTDSPITVANERLEEVIGGRVKFYSATYRLMKLPTLEPDCEDYGQAVVYNGGIPHNPHRCVLDDHHIFETGKMAAVCGNTYRMLNETRFAPYFTFHGDWSRHYGLFEGCGKTIPYTSAGKAAGGSCC